MNHEAETLPLLNKKLDHPGQIPLCAPAVFKHSL